MSVQDGVHRLNWIEPDWPAPARVRALTTTRQGGCSHPPYAGLNLASHVGDDPAAVAANRNRLTAELGLPAEPLWLTQVHGCEVADARLAKPGCQADAAIASTPGEICAVLTADCLPVLFCDRSGTRVAAAHAGWRGLAAGVLETTLERLALPPGELLAWLGPAIGPQAFEVGDEVVAAFVAEDPGAVAGFRQATADRWQADLYGLARRRLLARGVEQISGGGYCTFSDPERFYSYRRDGRTGRMASLIWLVD